MRIRDFFRRGGGSTAGSSEKGYAAPSPDPESLKIARRHYEQDMREGFDPEEQLKRWAAEDDKDVKKPR